MNPQALTIIHDFEVEKVDVFPTHDILRLKLSRSSIRKERLFARSMPSLKRMFEATVNEIVKAKRDAGHEKTDDEMKGDIANVETEKLHEAIDRMIQTSQKELRYHENKGKT